MQSLRPSPHTSLTSRVTGMDLPFVEARADLLARTCVVVCAEVVTVVICDDVEAARLYKSGGGCVVRPPAARCSRDAAAAAWRRRAVFLPAADSAHPSAVADALSRFGRVRSVDRHGSGLVVTYAVRDHAETARLCLGSAAAVVPPPESAPPEWFYDTGASAEPAGRDDNHSPVDREETWPVGGDPEAPAPSSHDARGGIARRLEFSEAESEPTQAPRSRRRRPPNRRLFVDSSTSSEGAATLESVDFAPVGTTDTDTAPPPGACCRVS